MNQTVLPEKHKFTHEKSRIMFFETFFFDAKLHYIVQCESTKVIIGYPNVSFEIKREDKVKHKITCASVPKEYDKIYFGTQKGHIYSCSLRDNDSAMEMIDSKDGKPILGIHGDCPASEKTDLFVFSQPQIVRWYVNDKLEKTAKFTNTFKKVVIAKEFKNDVDIFCTIFFNKQVLHPYVYDLKTMKQMFEKTQEVNQKMDNLNVYKEDQLIEDQVCDATLCNDQPYLAATTKSNKVIVYQIDKVQGKLAAFPIFSVEEDDQTFSIDLLGSGLVYISVKGITTYNIRSRSKIAKKMLFKGQTSYTHVKWAKQKSSIIYLSDSNNRAKMFLQELNLL